MQPIRRASFVPLILCLTAAAAIAGDADDAKARPETGETRTGADRETETGAAAESSAETGGADEGEAAGQSLRRMTDRVSKQVEQLRGWSFDHPVERGVFTADQLRRKMSEEFDEEMPPALRRGREAFLTLTGIIPAGRNLKRTWIDLLSTQVAGYYDPKTETFYLPEDLDQRYGPLPLRVIIAHELTHALDDQRFGLDPLIEPVRGDTDREFAATALIEGSATALMTRYMVHRMREKGLGMLGMMAGSAMMMSRDAEARAQMRRMPRYFQSFIAAYTLGRTFLFWTNVTDDGGYEDKPVGDAVLKAAKDPPASSEQILHPGKYWNAEQRDDPVRVAGDGVAEWIEPLGLRVAHEETAGELLAAIVTAPEQPLRPMNMGGGEKVWTHEAARGWGGDRFYVLRPADKKDENSDGGNGENAEDGDDAKDETENDKQGTAVGEPRGLWITLWDTRDDRAQFTAAYERWRPSRERAMFPLGDRAAVYLYGFDEEAAKKIEKRMTQSPPTFTKGGNAWSMKE